jgi:hypothetical protein
MYDPCFVKITFSSKATSAGLAYGRVHSAEDFVEAAAYVYGREEKRA